MKVDSTGLRGQEDSSVVEGCRGAVWQFLAYTLPPLLGGRLSSSTGAQPQEGKLPWSSGGARGSAAAIQGPKPGDQQGGRYWSDHPPTTVTF